MDGKINGLISCFKLWRDLKYLALLFGIVSVILLWPSLFYSGTEILRLKGCFESICSDISINDNGTFWMSVSTQSDCYSCRGNYIAADGIIYLYDQPILPAEYQSDAINELMQENCVFVSAEDFRLWSGCFEPH